MTPQQGWAPRLRSLRLLGDGRTVSMLSADAEVLWWCFPGLHHVDVDDAAAGASATTLLCDDAGVVEVRDGLVPRGDGVLLVRLLRRRGATEGLAQGRVAGRRSGVPAFGAVRRGDLEAIVTQLSGR